MKKVYKGLISVKDYGESSDDVFVGNNDEPLAQVLADDRLEYGEYASVNYYISDKEKSIDRLQENQLRTVLGDIEADYNQRWSEITGYLWTDADIKVGGHNLLAELETHNGKVSHPELKRELTNLRLFCHFPCHRNKTDHIPCLHM